MTRWSSRWYALAVSSAVALAACMSGRGDAVSSTAQDASAGTDQQQGVPTVTPSRQGPGTLGDQHSGAPAPPRPLIRPDAGAPRCGPHELDCCGVCIPKDEKRCPDNVHCPTPAPEL
jgi:hypothetical protein